ncbi:MAG TPA: putative quinol monooxygenase [Rhizomicrobium sp.]|nr:putative quinol monooxygenase [Rhizomicrobium sp.]
MELFIFARAHARKGREADVEHAIREVLPETAKEAGCLAVSAYRSTQDPQLFYIHSRWDSEAAFERHIDLPHTQRFVAAIEPLVDHPFKAERMGKIA